jgi:hypothetical protein
MVVWAPLLGDEIKLDHTITLSSNLTITSTAISGSKKDINHIQNMLLFNEIKLPWNIIELVAQETYYGTKLIAIFCQNAQQLHVLATSNVSVWVHCAIAESQIVIPRGDDLGTNPRVASPALRPSTRV